MRLLIVSNMPHHRRADGTLVGWGATVQEIDQLATRFTEIRHIAPLHDGDAPASFLPYATDRVKLVPVRERGGDRWRDKLGVLAGLPSYVPTMLRELGRADMVHLRCPANLPMIAATLLPFVHRPRARWIKYAGNWRPERRGSLPFAYQRWLLAHAWHRGRVTINGAWPDQPAHVASFYNPSLDDAEVSAARKLVEGKRLERPDRLLYVGMLWDAKGVDVAIDALAALPHATLELVGDGPGRGAYEQQVARLGLGDRVTFHGALPHAALAPHYARAHFMILPSRSEGWPKVLSEGMAYGAVPIASAVGAIPQYLADFGAGVAIDRADPAAYARAIADYTAERWLAQSRRGLAAAERFTYGHYLREIDRMILELAA